MTIAITNGDFSKIIIYWIMFIQLYWINGELLGRFEKIHLS